MDLPGGIHDFDQRWASFSFTSLFLQTGSDAAGLAKMNFFYYLLLLPDERNA